MTYFADQVDHMRDIFRGLETYGTGSPSEQATRFRLENLFPEVIKRAKANSAATPPPRDVDLLVSLSGFSPATTILAFELIRVLVENSAIGLTRDFGAGMIIARVRDAGLPAAGNRGVLARAAGAVLLVQGSGDTRAAA